MTGGGGRGDDGRAERAMFAALRLHIPLPAAFSPSSRPATSVRRSTSFTFQEPSYDVVDVQFVGLSHRAGVSCAFRTSHEALYYRDDRRFTEISHLCAARHGIALAASYKLLAMAVRITAHSTLHSLSLVSSPLSSPSAFLLLHFPMSPSYARFFDIVSISPRFYSILLDIARSCSILLDPSILQTCASPLTILVRSSDAKRQRG